MGGAALSPNVEEEMKLVTPRHPTRDEVRTADCPRCGASVVESCSRDNGAPRRANHMERVRAYEATLEPRSSGKAEERAVVASCSRIRRMTGPAQLTGTFQALVPR